jgi:hypothetical protein
MAGYRTLRGALGTDVRQPDLGSPPIVASVTGFGSGSGAFIASQGSGADQSQGLVIVQAGINPGVSGTVVLVFPVIPPSMFIAGEWCSVTQSLASHTLTITWTATRAILPNERLALAYQWSIST